MSKRDEIADAPSKNKTFRQWLIGMALSGIWASPTNSLPSRDGANVIVSCLAIESADAILGELGREAGDE